MHARGAGQASHKALDVKCDTCSDEQYEAPANTPPLRTRHQYKRKWRTTPCHATEEDRHGYATVGATHTVEYKPATRNGGIKQLQHDQEHRHRYAAEGATPTAEPLEW